MGTRLAAVLPVLIAAVGCGGSIRPPSSPENGMIFGNIVIDEKYVPTGVALAEYGKVYVGPFNPNPTGWCYGNGNFFFEDLKPGKYWLWYITSGNTRYWARHKTEEDLNAAIVDLKPGEIHFLGSFKITDNTIPIFNCGDVTAAAAMKPTEEDLLKFLAESLKEKGWGERLEARLKELQEKR